MERMDYDLTGRIEGAAPPKTVGLALEVVRITTSIPRQFIMLNDKPWGAWWHWFGRSLRCNFPEECQRCARNIKKYRVYYHAIELLPTFKKEVLIELTHMAACMIDIQLATQPLRGSQFKIAKTKGGKHGRFVIEVLPKRISDTTLMPGKSPAKTMSELWDMNESWNGSKAENLL